VLEASDVVGGEKVVLASTGGVYDWVEGALTEETPVRPTDIYTLSKVTNEQQLALWVAKTGRAGIIARIFNTIGRHDRNGHLIPDILRQLGSNGHCAVVKLGNLDTRRDYIYVDDTAACLARIAQSEQCEGLERFNVGTGHQVDVRSIVECIARIRNRPVECQSDPGRMRRVDRSSQLADMTKTSSQLGWMPRYGLEEALRLTAGEEA
jgi:UDP-glucose 4-epimerase